MLLRGDGAGDGLGHLHLLRPRLIVAEPAGNRAAGPKDVRERHAAPMPRGYLSLPRTLPATWSPTAIGATARPATRATASFALTSMILNCPRYFASGFRRKHSKTCPLSSPASLPMLITMRPVVSSTRDTSPL